jgi:AcrR family transcriptional regulator
MPKPVRKTQTVLVRNPKRTRERILAAALKEYAARGFSGARVDAIARRAAINKRMLYHYFGDKESLFREIVRTKMAERFSRADNLSEDPKETLPFWFQAACHDPDWVRLLAWEALQGNERKIIDVRRRSDQMQRRVVRVKKRQKNGFIAKTMDPRHVLLTMVSLTMFPMAFPQLTRLITRQSVHDPAFQAERIAFLQAFADSFHPPKKSKTVRRAKIAR